MHLIARRYGATKAALAAACVLFGVLCIENTVSAAQHSATEFVKPREQLAYFEIYHMRDEGMLYRVAISLESLLTRQHVDDYVRIEASNTFAVSGLYETLNGTVFDSSIDCSTMHFDARWAIVLNYVDKTKDAIGFGPSSKCVHLLNRKEPIAASRTLFQYVQRNFPFMH
jgi:uncharacterized Fe-S cluster-containing radical SAM superfamily protein